MILIIRLLQLQKFSGTWRVEVEQCSVRIPSLASYSWKQAIRYENANQVRFTLLTKL